MTNITLPRWVETLRPHQVTAIQSTLESYETGNKVVFMEAPTGSGKTLIAEMVRQYMDCRGIYLCSSLSLQHQYMRDFPKASLLMGRGNYRTKDYPHLFGTSFSSVSAADCTKKKDDGVFKCKWCDPVSECPYEIAKRGALLSSQVCSNTYYYLYEVNHPGTLRGRQLVVIDECDTLEAILMSFIQVSFSSRQIEFLQLPTPDKKTVQSAWIDWADESLGILESRLKTLPPISLYSSASEVKMFNRISRAIEDVRRLTGEQGLSAGGWVYTGYREGDVEFKPVRVSSFAEEYLWRHGVRFLLMSATIIYSHGDGG